MPVNDSPELMHSLQRFSNILTEAEIQSILSIQEEALPTGIRINILKGDPNMAIEDLSSRYGWQTEPVPFCENAWVIHGSEISPGKTIEHRMGQYYLQDAASMVPVSLFSNECPNPIVLDMASSPGGKTTHLIDRTQDKGFIIANDASVGRIPALRSVLTTWGGINQVVTQYPGENFGRWFPETFDQVLLDAPCSMESLRSAPNHPARSTTSDERLRLQARQIELLISGLSALKTGGEMVYATCSLAPEEDEAVLESVLKAFPGTFSITDRSDKFSFHTRGLTEFNGQHYSPSLQNSLRLWPHLTGMSGFFCALLTKNKPISRQSETPPQRDFSKTDLQPTTPDLYTQVNQQFEENYGFCLHGILHDYRLEIYSRYDQLFLIPRAYLDHFSFLPYTYIGMPLGKWNAKDIEPSHPFISRFGHLFKVGKITISESYVDQWIAGRDIRHPETTLPPRGQYLLITDASGRNLGLGRLLPKRLRNLLPRQSI